MDIVAELSDLTLFGIPILDAPALLGLVFRYALNVLVTFIIVRFNYFPQQFRNKDFFHTYFLLNTLIFLVCFLFNNVQMSSGFAFGLFAIFSILRYRTTMVPIQEMTFLFTMITVGIINSLAGVDVSLAEVLFANVVIIAFTWLLKLLWFDNQEYSKLIVFEKIELIKPENEAVLLADLRARTGLDIHRAVVEEIDFLKDIATVRIFFSAPKQGVTA